METVYKHVAASEPHRTIEVRTDDERVRIVCDAAGIAAVSHVLSWQEWEELVRAVDEKTGP